MIWHTLSTELILSSYHVSINKDKIQLPDGAVIDDFYTVTIPDAALVVALTSDGNVLLKSEYSKFELMLTMLYGGGR
jgi:hypothetical protein